MVFTLCLLSLASIAQSNDVITDCGLGKAMFNSDTSASFSSQTPVISNVLPNIKTSSNCFEMRLYNISNVTSRGAVAVITIKEDSVFLKSYYYEVNLYRLQFKPDFKIVYDKKDYVVGVKTTMEKSKALSTGFKDSLINSSIFTMHDVKKMLKAAHGKREKLDNFSTIDYIEIKHGSQFRNFHLADDFNSGKTHINYNKQVQKIYALFRKF